MKKISARKIVLASFLAGLFLLGPANPAQAGCGCDKPPPAPAEARPQVTYAGTEVTLLHTDLQSGQAYTVVFTSGITGETATVETQAVDRKDIADGQLKPHLAVSLPPLPLGPTSISVSLAGQSGAIMFVTDDTFTVAPQPIVVPAQVGEYHFQGFEAAVSRDAVVYLSLDISNVAQPMVFQAI